MGTIELSKIKMRKTLGNARAKRNPCMMYCKPCDDSTLHIPMRVFLAVKNKIEIPVNHATTKIGIRMQCQKCGGLQEAFKHLAYSLNHWGGRNIED